MIRNRLSYVKIKFVRLLVSRISTEMLKTLGVKAVLLVVTCIDQQLGIEAALFFRRTHNRSAVCEYINLAVDLCSATIVSLLGAVEQWIPQIRIRSACQWTRAFVRWTSVMPGFCT